MTFRTRIAGAGMLALALAVGAACGGDDDDQTPTPSPSATADATSTTQPSTASPSPSATSTPWPGEAHALSPQFFLYEAADGDTVSAIADIFDAQEGPAPAAFVEEIKSLNELTGEELVAGQVLAIPLVLPGDLSLIPENSIEAALGSGSGGPVLVQPSLQMREGFLGRLVLHRVRLDLPAAPGAEAGYVMEYWTADRPPMKGGEVDPDAHVSDAAFVVAGGTLASELQGSGDKFHAWERDGTELALASDVDSPTAEQLAGMLQPASER